MKSMLASYGTEIGEIASGTCGEPEHGNNWKLRPLEGPGSVKLEGTHFLENCPYDPTSDTGDPSFLANRQLRGIAEQNKLWRDINRFLANYFIDCVDDSTANGLMLKNHLIEQHKKDCLEERPYVIDYTATQTFNGESGYCPRYAMRLALDMQRWNRPNTINELEEHKRKLDKLKWWDATKQTYNAWRDQVNKVYTDIKQLMPEEVTEDMLLQDLIRNLFDSTKRDKIMARYSNDALFVQHLKTLHDNGYLAEARI